MASHTGISEYLANGWLGTLRNIPFVVPVTCVQLHTDDPGLGGTSNVFAGASDLLAASFADPAGGILVTTGAPPSWDVSSAGSIKYASVWDGFDSGSDNWLLNAVLSSPQTVANGDVFRLGGNITLKITGLVG